MTGATCYHLAELKRIRAAGTDPRLLRWCSWPDCLASFDASSGPEGGGWKQYRGMAVLLCPRHAATEHWPSYDMDRDDLTSFKARCGCGDYAKVSPSTWEAVFAWWEQHLTDEATDSESDGSWTHGTRLGRAHRSVRRHLVEDHGVSQGQVDAWSDGAVHGHHDGVHRETWAYAKVLAHPAPGDVEFRRSAP